MTTASKFAAEFLDQILHQENFNQYVVMGKVNGHDLEHAIRVYADAKHAEYPQYRNHFDNYVLVRVLRRVDTKGGAAFEEGDISIGIYEPGVLGQPGKWVVYSIRNNIDTVVSYGVVAL